MSTSSGICKYRRYERSEGEADGDLLFEQFVLSPDQLEVSPPDGGRPEPPLRVGVQVEDDLLPPGPLVPGHHPPHVLGVVRRERLDVHPGQLEEGGEPVRDEDQSEGSRVTFSNYTEI